MTWLVLKPSPDLASRLDLALWSPTASSTDYEALFQGAPKLGVRAVCIPSARVSQACARLEDTNVKIVVLTGFPLGNADPDANRFEAEAAIDNGAQEIETVLNYAALKENAKGLLRELRDIVECAEERPVIIAAELAWLSNEEKVRLCHLALDAGITGISTGTGFWPNLHPDPEDIKLLREAASQKFVLKAAPITDEQAANAILAAGANRFGVVFDASAIRTGQADLSDKL